MSRGVVLYLLYRLLYEQVLLTKTLKLFALSSLTSDNISEAKTPRSQLLTSPP